MALPIIFNMININTAQTNGTVSIGENLQSQWSSHSKQNFGLGYLFGANFNLNTFDIIFDNDITDAIIFDNDFSIAGQSQAL